MRRGAPGTPPACLRRELPARAAAHAPTSPPRGAATRPTTAAPAPGRRRPSPARRQLTAAREHEAAAGARRAGAPGGGGAGARTGPGRGRAGPGGAHLPAGTAAPAGGRTAARRGAGGDGDGDGGGPGARWLAASLRDPRRRRRLGCARAAPSGGWRPRRAPGRLRHWLRPSVSLLGAAAPRRAGPGRAAGGPQAARPPTAGRAVPKFPGAACAPRGRRPRSGGAGA